MTENTSHPPSRPPMSEQYEPNSTNAMFSRVLIRLDQQDTLSEAYRKHLKEELHYIKTSVDETNGRVTKLESERWKTVGFFSAMSIFFAAAWEWMLRGKG